MGRALFGFPNRADDGTLSGGSWETSLPLANLQTRYLSQVARSTDDAKASTQFENDLGANYPIRALGVFGHNLSLAAKYRIRGRPAGTFTGATTRFYRDEDGVLQEGASGEARHWNYEYDENGVLKRATLLEGARTNEFTQPEDLTHADWAVSNLSARTANQAGDPGGGTGLDKLVEDSNNGPHGVNQDKTLTANANYALSAWFIANTRTWAVLRFFEAVSSANQVRAWFNLSTGVVGTTAALGTGAFETAYVEDWTDVVAGLYRCVLVGSVGNGATGITAAIALADADASVSYTGDGTSSLFAGFAMLEDNAEFASSYHDATRNADFLQDTIDFTPADIVAADGATFYSEWIEGGTAFAGALRYWQIGGPAEGSDPRMHLRSFPNEDGEVRFGFDDGTTFAQALIGAAVSLSDHVRARAVIFLDGDWKIQLHISVDGGPETSSGVVTIGSDLPDTWSDNIITFGDTPDGVTSGFAAHIAHVFAPGVKTLAEMQALTPSDDVFYYWQPYDSTWLDAYPAIYPSGSTLWGSHVGGDKLTTEQHGLTGVDKYPHPIIRVPDQHYNAQHWSFEFDDTANADGYVEVGRLVIAPGNRPGRNMTYEVAPLLKWSTSSKRHETEGGSFHYDERVRRRMLAFVFRLLDADEALVQMFEFIRRAGIAEQFLWIFDEDDTHHMHRRSFLATLEELSGLEYPYADALHNDVGYKIVEEV